MKREGWKPRGALPRTAAALFLLALLFPGEAARAARTPGFRATLVLPEGARLGVEIAGPRFVHYRRRIRRQGRWVRPEPGALPRSRVTLAASDDRLESRYLLWENQDPGIRLNSLCGIRLDYRGQGEARKLHVVLTHRKGRVTERPVLDLLDAHQPVPVHFSGSSAGRRRDLPLPPLYPGGEAPEGAVLDRIVSLSPRCAA
ncbi:MAG: hypothetical protein HY509_05895 [Acidobacteria bacterium]|nr:hypothetical protein [Acidobacteriota bacterium]